jgi:glycine cleavage system H protein
MSNVCGFDIPDDLYYLVEKHVWARTEDELVVVGMTAVAQSLAGSIVAVTTKRVGRALQRGKSVGTVESAKWVGPVPAPVSGEIAAVNEALSTDPGLLNRDPYGAGWVAKLKASDWEAESGELLRGPAAIAAYEQSLLSQGLSCDK